MFWKGRVSKEGRGMEGFVLNVYFSVREFWCILQLKTRLKHLLLALCNGGFAFVMF